MKLEDVLQLGAMGFTKEEIMKLVNSDGGETAGTKPATPDKTEPEKKEETKEKPEDKKEETPESKEIKEMKAQMESLKKMLQTQAIQNSEQPKEKTVDDLLGILIKG